jgi:hypothetical protein
MDPRTNNLFLITNLDAEETAALVDFADITTDNHDDESSPEEESPMQNQAANVIHEQPGGLLLFNFTDIFTGADDHEDKAAKDNKCIMPKPAAASKGRKLSVHATENRRYVPIHFSFILIVR